MLIFRENYVFPYFRIACASCKITILRRRILEMAIPYATAIADFLLKHFSNLNFEIGHIKPLQIP